MPPHGFDLKMPTPVTDSAYKHRRHASTIRSKWRIILAAWLVTLVSGTGLVATLYAGVFDPDTTSAVIVEFRNLGASDSASGIRLTTDVGELIILVSRDGYLSVSSGAPDWRSFPHIDGQYNRLTLTQSSQQQHATLYINGERAWQGMPGLVRECRVMTRGEAEITWIRVQECS